MTTSWHAEIADWSKLDQQAAIKAVRQQVFIVEQSVPVELEWDELDEKSIHLLISSDETKDIATARMHVEETIAHIGRMAVLKEHRQQGVGTLMLETLLKQARINGVKQIVLNAQTSAIEFHQRYKFNVVGDEFQDAGIPHYKMVLHINE
ncbi:MAG: GNAT family N-acetyltransferase [Sulfuriflexus sp.]|nr:GNAT family N-acetyltransferase [Sulfuriflexus sp.]